MRKMFYFDYGSGRDANFTAAVREFKTDQKLDYRQCHYKTEWGNVEFHYSEDKILAMFLLKYSQFT